MGLTCPGSYRTEAAGSALVWHHSPYVSQLFSLRGRTQQPWFYSFLLLSGSALLDDWICLHWLTRSPLDL